MHHLLSLLTLLFFAWPSIAQAFPYLDAAAKTSAEKEIALSKALNHGSDLMWEGGIGAAFSLVPLVKEVRHSFNTGKNITVGGAHFSRSLDDSILRLPANSNVPIKPTANTNVMPLPHVVDATEVNGIQRLAQKLSGGGKTTKDYRQIYMTSKPTWTGRIDSNRQQYE